MLARTHTPVYRPFVRDYLGELVPEGKTNLDFTEARDGECQWHQLQIDNHASTLLLSFLQAGALPATQPKASKH